MNKLKLFALMVTFILSDKLFAQTQKQTKEEQDLATIRQKVKPLLRINELSYEGKVKEALALLIRYTDSIKIETETKPQTKTFYLSLKKGLARQYIETGNFSDAEKLLKEVLAEQPVNEDSRNTLNQLSMLYEKMGDNESAERILEKMIVVEYSYQAPDSKKQLFFDHYRKMYSYADSASRTNLTQLAKDFKKVKSPVSKAANNYFNSVAGKKTSDAEINRGIEKQWLDYQKQKKYPDTSREAQAMKMMNALLELQLNYQSKKENDVTYEELESLRNGALRLSGRRNGIDFNKPWDEVKRLFMIYKNTNNYAGAEALIKQAIAIDDAHPDEDGSPTGVLFNAAMSLNGNDFTFPGMDIEKYGLNKNILATSKLANTARKKYGGIDIFYIQNKVLLAQLYKENDRPAEYELLRDTIYQFCKKLDATSNPFIIIPLAEAYTRIEKYPEAEAAYKKIIKYHNTPIAFNPVSWVVYLSSLQQLAKVYQATADYTHAKATLTQAMKYDKAIAVEKFPAHMELVISMGQLCESMGQLKTAEQYCSTVLHPVMNNVTDNFSFLSEREKISLINSQVSAFDFSASLLLSDPKASDEFATNVYSQQLQLKGLVLNDAEQVFNQIRKSKNSQLKKLFNNWRSNREAITWQYGRPVSPHSKHVIDSLKTIANDQEKRINQLSASYNINRQNQQIGFRQIQAHLNVTDAAIEFVRFRYYHKRWTDSVFYAAFIITKGNAKPYFVPLCEEQKLAAILESERSSYRGFIDTLYGNGINPGDNRISNRKSDQLYKLIWRPINQYFVKANIKKIFLSPVGLLSRISFEALPYNNNEYLTDKYEIRQYSTLREMAGQKLPVGYKSNTSSIVFGDINYGPPNDVRYWPALNTSDNITVILNQFKLNHMNAIAFTDTDASEGRLKQLSGRSPKLLYIITHGFSKPPLNMQTDINAENKNQSATADDPMMRSGIIMANANPAWGGEAVAEGSEDGILTAYEIANLDLSNTELVFLGACETALGDIKSTEGVFGLQRGFKLAGVQNMLLGLWDLNLTETNQLISEFNKNKISNGMTTYRAFKTAQGDLRKKYPPYIWAGMVLIE